MKTTRRAFIYGTLAGGLAQIQLTGCSTRNYAITLAEQADKNTGNPIPGFEETKAIAEEGFIYGLPIVMNYAVMNEYANYLDFAFQFAPAGAEEMASREKLARIGIGPAKTFYFKNISIEHKLEVGLGMKEGEAKVIQAVNHIGKDINGWKVGAAFGDRAFFNGNWLKRAAGAKAGIYGNDAVEAMYPMSREDAIGQLLDGSKHNYTLTFAAGHYPPVNAFWSVTMYDGTTQLLIKNPIDRYLINSPMLPKMKKNSDGSLTLLIQKDSPGKNKESNWLPAPNGQTYLVMRLNWPKTTPPSNLSPGEGSWQLPGIQRVN